MFTYCMSKRPLAQLHATCHDQRSSLSQVFHPFFLVYLHVCPVHSTCMVHSECTCTSPRHALGVHKLPGHPAKQQHHA